MQSVVWLEMVQEILSDIEGNTLRLIYTQMFHAVNPV